MDVRLSAYLTNLNRSFLRAFLVCVSAGALLFTSCAAPEFMSASTIQYPRFPDQTKKVEDPSKARIYLIRKGAFESAGFAFEFSGTDVEAAIGPETDASGNRHLIGKVGPGSYLCWEETPHRFTFQRIAGDTNSMTTIDLNAGNVYYLRAYIHNGWDKFTMRIDVLDEKEGLAMLKKCRPPNNYLVHVKEHD